MTGARHFVKAEIYAYKYRELSFAAIGSHSVLGCRAEEEHHQARNGKPRVAPVIEAPWDEQSSMRNPSMWRRNAMATVDMSATRGLAGVSDAPTAIRSRLARSIGTLFLRWREGWEAAAEMDRRVREVKWEAESSFLRFGVPMMF